VALEIKEASGAWKGMFFLKLLLPLAAGIITEYYLPVHSGFLYVLFFSPLLLFIFCNGISFSKLSGMVWMSGLALQLVFFSFGRILMYLHQDKLVIESACFEKNKSNLLMVELLNDPVQKKNRLKGIAKVRALLKNDTSYYEEEKILIYFNDNRDSEKLTEGSRILTERALLPIENFPSFGFDYRKYCSLKHIHSQLFLNQHDYSILPKEKSNPYSSVLSALRKKIVLVIKTNVPDKSESGLLEALLVGFTDDLDPAILRSYADSGVVHIIAISGLHLALICQILQLVLQKTGKEKSARWIKLFVILICLWTYGILSGASPSVIRADAMFTLVLFAKNIFRQAVLFNTLAASAFLLICFDPFWIFDTGFQLSYAAVLSLGLFSKPVRGMIRLKNKMLKALWDAASVSIAAQILTTPISIYYFHRFPSYFLFANLLAVPLSSIILICGIFLCLCAPVQPVAQWIGRLLGFLIRLLNGFIEKVSHLPGAVLGNLNYNLISIILLYFILFSFYHYLRRKEKGWLFAGLGSIPVFQIIRLIQ
jgi:competence protein ComEC